MALRAWMEGDIRLAIRLLQWANPQTKDIKKDFDDKRIEYKVA